MIYYIQKIGGVSGEVYPVAVIDSPISVRWVRCFDEPGNFELYLPSSAELFTLLAVDIGVLVVTREDDDVPMYIENFKLSESTEGETILIGGRTMDAVMASRVVGYPTTYDHYPSMVVARKLMLDNMIDPESTEDYPLDDTARKLAPFAVEIPSPVGDNITRSFGGENLLTAVDGLLREFGRGLRCRLVQGVFTFEFYRGSDKPHVVFSADNEMLISCEYEVDIRDKCNVVFVSATGPDSETQADGSNPYTLVRQAGNPLTVRYYRREGSMTAGSVTTEKSVTLNISPSSSYVWEPGAYDTQTGEPITSAYRIRCTHRFDAGLKYALTLTPEDSSKRMRYWAYYYDQNDEYMVRYDYNKLSGTELAPPSGAVYVRFDAGLNTATGETVPSDLRTASLTRLLNVSVADYKADVAAQGLSGIVPESKIISAQIAETGLYRAGVDYDIGDTVYLETAKGVRGSAKITEITEVEDAEGYRIFPTFSDWTVV